MSLGIAGWPLRDASIPDLQNVWRTDDAAVVELPKDMVDNVSIKQLFGILSRLGLPICLAGTTDFAGLGGMEWADYRRYLDIQLAQARFLGARLFRGFLQAESAGKFSDALDRLQEYSRANADMEFVLETHNGWESTATGLEQLLNESTYRMVVDFANIEDAAAVTRILRGDLGDRIAYFHLRCLPESADASDLADIERQALAVYPDHNFLWEPKTIGTQQALEVWRTRPAILAI